MEVRQLLCYVLVGKRMRHRRAGRRTSWGALLLLELLLLFPGGSPLLSDADVLGVGTGTAERDKGRALAHGLDSLGLGVHFLWLDGEEGTLVLDGLLPLLRGGFVGLPGVLLGLLPLGPEDELRLVLLQAGDVLRERTLGPVLPSVVNNDADGLSVRLGKASTLIIHK